MEHLVVIIGNGFDLDLGLPAKYSDFAKSYEWKELYSKYEFFIKDSTYGVNSLIAHLNKVSGEMNWFDIEEEIYNFVNNHPVCTAPEAEKIMCEFDDLKKSLSAYLTRVAKEFKTDQNRLAWVHSPEHTRSEIWRRSQRLREA